MGEALYRKYRPKSLSDVVGQNHITKTLHNAIKNGRISHGYLFSGPRGVGKTSIARILAYQVNNLPYGDNSGTLDIIEIDAASNRRIDEIRELRDKVHIAPSRGKYKVYIIDEVHMLTREAFNALLKTLEEPPAHVIFILATTEAHKLPETIISRTQHFTFKPVAKNEVAAHLMHIAKDEKIPLSKEAALLIAKHGDGSFRDSISLLDQLSTLKEITTEDVQKILGIPDDEHIAAIYNSVEQGDIAELLDKLSSAQDSGFSAAQISKQLSQKFRDQLVAGKGTHDTVMLLQKLIDVPASHDPFRLLELTLIDRTLDHEAQIPSQPTNNSKPTQLAVKPQTKTSPQKPKESVPQELKKSNNHSSVSPMEFINKEMWTQVLELLKKKYNTLYGVARMATPAIDEDKLVLKVPYAFHQKRLNEEKNSKIISTTITEVSGGHLAYTTIVDNKITTKKPDSSKKQSDNSDTLASVTQIFGGGEVLES